MGLIINKADFIGKYTIAKNAFDNIDSYIAKYEERYLIDLMGVELFNLFKASFSAGLPTGDYLLLYNPIQEDDTCSHAACWWWDWSAFNWNTIRISDGIKEMLLGFVYFEYLRDQKYYNTPSGTVVCQSENSRETGFDESGLFNRYNTSIRSYWTIQWYIWKNIDKYEKFNGQCKQLTNFI